MTELFQVKRRARDVMHKHLRILPSRRDAHKDIYSRFIVESITYLCRYRLFTESLIMIK